MKKLAILFLSFTVLGFYSLSLFAIGTDQNVIEKGVKLNHEYNEIIRIFTEKSALSINVYNWTIDENGNSVIFQDKPIKEDWLKLPAYVEKKDPSANCIEIPYTIKITDSKQVEYLGKIMISEIGTNNSSIDIAMGIGIPIYIWQQGKVSLNKNSCVIKKVEYNPKVELLRILVENKGDIHIRPEIDFRVQKKSAIVDKSKIQKIENLTSDWPILAKSQRWFSKQVPLDAGKYIISFRIKFGKEAGFDFDKSAMQNFAVKGL
ncbi:MAG: hypothetical protein WC860_00720 [Candidatus Margulisiibacteriota bacterium]|jgi:hypothetical protein